MFDFIWRRFRQWQPRKAPVKRRVERARLGVEMLENRITPAFATISGTTLTINAGGDNLSIANAGFEMFTVTDSTNPSNTFTTAAATPITAMTINMGTSTGLSTLTFAGTPSAPIDLTGPTTTNSSHQEVPTTAGPDLTITGSGNETISATDLFLLHTTAGLSMTLGAGTENTTFTDSNITGSATISHTGSGSTSFTVNTSTATPNLWGSLSITNGAGSDINTIEDTNFSGSLSINNGAGDGSTNQFGGSQNIFAAINSPNLLTIGGAATINTTNGQSDTEVNDYNVHGLLTIGGGTGMGGANPIGNFVGVANNQTNALNPSAVTPIPGTAIPGVPTFGSISITDGTDTGGLQAYIGTNQFNGNLIPAPNNPILVTGNLSVTATGTGSPIMTLDDLTVDGTATLSTATSNSNVTINVLACNTTSSTLASAAAITTFGALTINSLATGTNTVNLQNTQPNTSPVLSAPGTFNVTGALTVGLGAGLDTVLVGSAYVPAVKGPPAVAAIPAGTVTVAGSFNVTGTGGSKTVTVVGATFGGMSWKLTGTDTGNGIFAGTNAETATFTGTNVTGTATIANTVSGTTSFTITITNPANNPPVTPPPIPPSPPSGQPVLNTWGSLSITNGPGAATNDIYDTVFTGNVSIANGTNTTNNITTTIFSDDPNGYYTNLLNVAGNLSITNTSGPANIDVQDYSIGGNVTLGGGTGVANVTNSIALVAFQTSSVSGTPVVGGSVTITGSPVLNATLNVEIGAIGATDLPITVGKGVTATLAGAGDVNLAIDDLSTTGTFTLTGTLAGNATAGTGALAVAALDDTFGALKWTLSGRGTEDAAFANTSVFGASTVTTSSLTNGGGTTGAGASPTTEFVIETSVPATTPIVNNWGSLSITNGTGADYNFITDTDFTGNLTISNGNGATGDTSQFGGSQNIIAANYDTSLLTIGGNLSIMTGTGQSDTEVYDYNVQGSVTLGAGTGVANQAQASVIGLDNNNKNINAALNPGNAVNPSGTAITGIPVVGGSVTITGGTQRGPTGSPLNPGLNIALGTNLPPPYSGVAAGTNNYPLVIQGTTFAVTTSGSGSVNLYLYDLDLTAPQSKTTITLGSGNLNDIVTMQGSTAFASVYDTFTITATSAVGTTYNLQDVAGTLDFAGTVTGTLGASSGGNFVTLNLGVPPGAGKVPIVDFFGLLTFSATGTGNALNEGVLGTNVFFIAANAKFTDL